LPDQVFLHVICKGHNNEKKLKWLNFPAMMIGEKESLLHILLTLYVCACSLDSCAEEYVPILLIDRLQDKSEVILNV